MQVEDLVRKCGVPVGIVLFVAVMEYLFLWPWRRRGPIEGSLVLYYDRDVVIVGPAFFFLVGVGFLSYPLFFGWENVFNAYGSLGIGGLAVFTSVICYVAFRIYRVRLDPLGITDWKQPTFRWDEVAQVLLNSCNDLEFHTADGRIVTVYRAFAGFNDALPLFLAYLPEPARTQFGKLLVRN